MSYEYKPSKAEEKAEALLRSKGWSVSTPACPECHGAGRIWGWSTYTMVTKPSMAMTSPSRPCPNGCPAPTLFYSSIAPGARTVVADGTVGMRRGE